MRLQVRKLHRRLRLAAAAIPMLFAACRPAVQQGRPDPEPTYRLVDAMPEFWRMMEATAGKDDSTWLAAYRARILEPQRTLFALARGGLDDTSLVRFRRAVVRNTGRFRAATDSAPAQIAGQWARLVRELPDVKGGAVVYLLPAPPNAIGGWFRPLDAHDAVVLGSNPIATASSRTQRDVFIMHELIHLYHAQVNPQIRDVVTTFFMARGNHATALYELLWVEGFASYASLRLTIGAQQGDVLSPPVVQANEAERARSARIFRERLDVTDRATVESLVYGGGQGLPPLAVSYLGLIVAEAMSRQYDLAHMARLQGTELRDAIRRALEEAEAAR